MTALRSLPLQGKAGVLHEGKEGIVRAPSKRSSPGLGAWDSLLKRHCMSSDTCDGSSSPAEA